MGGKTAIFGMDDDSEPKRGSILQHPEHDARIRDPMASGSNRLRACCLHQADFGHFPALKSPRRGGQRMNPEIGFACACPMLHQSRNVEWRRLMGLRRRAANAAEMESRHVGLEDAEGNDLRSKIHAARVDHFIFRRDRKSTRLYSSHKSESSMP